MKIDTSLLDALTAQAKASPRLRMNFDLRNSPQDGSQRMLNAIEPGSRIPIHRHRKSSETVVVIRGALREIFYDETGRNVIEVIDVKKDGDCFALNIPIDQWHSVESLKSGTVIMETKDGPYEPAKPEDFLDDLNL